MNVSPNGPIKLRLWRTLGMFDHTRENWFHGKPVNIQLRTHSKNAMDRANAKYLLFSLTLYAITAENSTNNPKNAENMNKESGANNKSRIIFSGIKKNGFINQLNDII